MPCTALGRSKTAVHVENTGHRLAVQDSKVALDHTYVRIALLVGTEARGEPSPTRRKHRVAVSDPCDAASSALQVTSWLTKYPLSPSHILLLFCGFLKFMCAATPPRCSTPALLPNLADYTRELSGCDRRRRITRTSPADTFSSVGDRQRRQTIVTGFLTQTVRRRASPSVLHYIADSSVTGCGQPRHYTKFE